MCHERHVPSHNFENSHTTNSQNLENSTCIKVYSYLNQVFDIFGINLSQVKVRSVTVYLLDSVPVVHKFFDVFLTDLPGLPLERDVEFIIDLEPGTRAISMALYHMDPAELKELNSQLQDLLGKGFIIPSMSLWGAPIIPRISLSSV